MPPTTETRAERKSRTRRAILDATLDLCEEQPLASLSLRQVAKQVGIVPTAFYRHFGSIEELGLALVEESMASLRAMLRDVRRGRPEYRDIIDASVAVLVEHVRAERRQFSFIARERFAGPASVRVEIAREIGLFERELAVDLGHLPGTETWSDTDLRVVSNLIVNAMVATIEALLAGGPADQQRVVDTVRTQLRMLMVGVVNWKSVDQAGS
ncbi:TetR family transcriptional regulator [Nocardioides sp. TF02-7]|uniref:TetR family transcriptional regulator n=1 Tax=Nocardioides sp. TF02-7 TaxID=2917724 RepID=UPI001F06A0CE|nr:TetR family transcriptional regulator [Nocardioides sp. TF02-7]UMG91956.1 TetR family transcriptional regulator [Nocardioides sp. TF02-7]